MANSHKKIPEQFMTPFELLIGASISCDEIASSDWLMGNLARSVS